ncbi:protein downstream neighbor of Son-like isoform X1 [Limulus polyphemus]|uniref:Protein downstream neighbor of Son-like isoform X1 n=2 Tax=Limulus polyphemus TaxID=6850 RepID=A0ABM1SYD3_LIMPO|nr:protein downstream neighbor of Son-like isoform X1 [Limulus polyphemus]XP_022248640.1 protein downstream neighbor of Son-like isoform X1 [Limulus polyphemus]XP_022248641.1 protein downstream neighbor of Son-like isoform X1 [Limulus polyphemus]XP_022248642.1 protein downstream neighbor of Son-like isoform X1 [Limulus polyphemus]XP_022248643.1 protein downstream neighbor of Son-like isoform X1 [Limulus polyphemus]XP_022248644.1 protein downstream neighbor of Son-like isoform X1 [Limulus polyp
MPVTERLVMTEKTEPISPEWVKPAEVLRLRKKLKRQSLSSVLQTVDLNLSAQQTFVRRIPVPKVKAVNPFRRHSPKKRSLSEVSQDSGVEDPGIFNSIAKKDKKDEVSVFEARVVHPILPALLDDNANFGSSTASEKQATSFSFDQNCLKFLYNDKGKRQLPVDWSLKTKVRFISTKPFPWKGSLKTSEEASGTTGFVRCLNTNKSLEKQECSLDTSPRAKFHQHCLLWMHPFFPWLQLFPRIHSERWSQGAFCIDSNLQEQLHEDWCNSFKSLFQLTKARQCPYFYLCAPTFTVLFHSAGVAGIQEFHAVLTPTTRGLRQALTDEGIEYTMPLKENDNSSDTLDGENPQLNCTTGTPTSQEETEGLVENKDSELKDPESDEEPVTWLESLGLSQQDFPALNAHKIKLQKEKHKKIDRRPQSLVCVRGPEVQALFNFLLNSRSCITNSGPLAGIPPTLLAPVGFFGATLRSLKVRQSWIKQGTSDLQMIEISGPILPSALHGLCSLLQSTQEEFSAHLATHELTIPFNGAFSSSSRSGSSGPPPVFATESLSDCGLPSDFLELICSENHLADVVGVNVVKFGKGLYTWNT